MHVKYVILNGFKSYAGRVVIGEFDPHFNAITGLNGSGKSNILDSIAFVLGLSSLQTVRALNLSDLVNKGANVKTATVSVVFGNCPQGIHRSFQGNDTGEIIISRTIEEASTCKYYLNSLCCTKKMIQDFLESVQVNINNPNFMIMQGKITKVVNMKPKEVLTLIEECIGANSYQTRRDKCILELDEKQKHVEQIKGTLQDSIEPAIRRYDDAFKLYEEFKEMEKTLLVLRQQHAIAAYGQYTKILDAKKRDLDGWKNTDRDEEDKIVQWSEQISDKQKRREEIKKETHRIAVEKVSGVEKQLKEERKKVALQEVALETATLAVSSGQQNLKAAKKALVAEEKGIAASKSKSGNLVDEFNLNTNEMQEAKSNIASCKERESELNAGKVLGEDGQTFDLRQRLVVVEDEIGKIRPKHNHENRLLETEIQKIRELEVLLRKTPSDSQVENEYKMADDRVQKLQTEMKNLKISPEEYAVSDSEYNLSSHNLNDLEQQRRHLTHNFPFLAFDYTPPTPNFNHSSVHGAIFELFEATELGKYTNSFEVAASPCLNVIVVDTDATSRAIIKHGNVATRRTYMPLSKVRRSEKRPPTQDELDRRLGGKGKACCALSLIKFSPEYENLLQYYLGRTILCDNMETARQVAFKMGYKAITLEGDVCDADGGMQGGTRKNLGHLINACQKLRAANKECHVLRQKVNELRRRLDLYSRHAPLLRKYDQAKRQLQNATEERQCTAYASIQSDMNKIKESVAGRRDVLKEWDTELSRWTKEQNSLQRQLDSFEEVKKNGLKIVRAELTKWTTLLEKAQKKYDSKKATFDSLELDLKAKEAVLTDLRKDIEKAEKELIEAQAAEVEKKSILNEANIAFEEKKKEHEDVSEEYRVWNEESANLEAEVASIQKKIQKIELTKLKRDNDMKNIAQDVKGTETLIDNLVRQYPGLKLRTDYDSLAKPMHSLKKCKENMDTMEKRYEDLRQRVDINAGEKLDESLELSKLAKTKLKVIDHNKNELDKAIGIVDQKKEELVAKAYEHVNTEFGLMMSTLLPESTAKLVPVDPKGSLDKGVNIHVSLGGVWKESLTELSGGQRSLVALALVLALCAYQPAPFYILDEIDAALDLSHTQNIGVLIKQRFKNTQFICVSLKDGMYSNSNVLFTTRFESGTSIVSRTSRFGNNESNKIPEKYANVGKKKERAGAARKL